MKDHENIDWPIASVDTLSPIRTFWEKATLIHAECHREKLATSINQLSRHWYDLHQLSHAMGKDALGSKHILNSVVEHKKAFFYAGYAHYDDCLHGKFLLIPTQPQKEVLEKDYKAMIQAGMFHQEPPAFENIVLSLSELEKKNKPILTNTRVTGCDFVL